ncbi:MAG: phenylalanine--tRNA ligase beta subunit-related protein [Chitinophagales bacterium]|nr:hypothetical protein [Bacteroidota bacterium]MCB9043686.1 hypothetical protein [Chitinophagales bacterium]
MQKIIHPHIHAEIKQKLPFIRLGIFRFSGKVLPVSEPCRENIAKLLSDEAETADAVVDATRKAYKLLGKDPSRYRPSAEALRRRIAKGQSLYSINNVVDILNAISAHSGFSIGGYDVAKIEGNNIFLSIGTADDVYEALGRGLLNIEYLPVLRNTEGRAFGSPTSDSVLTSIDAQTQDFLWVFFDFGGGSFAPIISLAQNLLTEFAALTESDFRVSEA